MEDESLWLPLVSRMCAERRAQTAGSSASRVEWLARSEAKLREANADASVPMAALWLAARAWALDNSDEKDCPDRAANCAQIPQNATQRLALDGDVVSAGTGDGSKKG